MPAGERKPLQEDIEAGTIEWRPIVAVRTPLLRAALQHAGSQPRGQASALDQAVIVLMRSGSLAFDFGGEAAVRTPAMQGMQQGMRQ